MGLQGLIGFGGGATGVNIQGAGTDPFSATGGNTSAGIEPGNGYTYHVYTTPGNFVVTGEPGTVEYLCVGGGGGGGGTNVGGGGGGGAVRTGSVADLGPGTYAITHGAGGTSTPVNVSLQWGRGNNGGNSVIAFPSPITSDGGGGGGAGNRAPQAYPSDDGGVGYKDAPYSGNGSAGGGGWRTGQGGSGGTYGNNGGNANGPGDGDGPGGSTAAGGGGGFGGAGESAPSYPSDGVSAGGNGGPAGPEWGAPHITADISPGDWDPVVGPTGVYGGGGAGGGDNFPEASPNAPGGGGKGSTGGCSGGSQNSTGGSAFTGGGGGGGGGCEGTDPPSPTAGQPGGSGLVVIRYSTP